MASEIDDIKDMQALRSRLKMRALSLRALGDSFLAARYFRAVYELEDNLIEKTFLAAEVALLDLEVLGASRPDLNGSMQRAWERLLNDHGLKQIKRRRRTK